MHQYNVNQLVRNDFGQLSLKADDKLVFEDLYLVCAFPLSAPNQHIAVLNYEGEEVAFIDRISDLPEETQQLVREELAKALFIPEITRIKCVNSIHLPAIWDVETNNGEVRINLTKEEDIRQVNNELMLITDSEQQAFIIKNPQKFDKKSRKIISHYCIFDEQ